MSGNERFKQGFGSWFWLGLTLATGLHLAVFLLAPAFATESWGRPSSDLVLVAPPEPPLPPPPEEVARPAAPVIARVALEDDPTIPPTRLEDHPPLLTPPPARGGELDRPGVWTPMTVRPTLRNEREVARLLERLYPTALRDAGIGGTATVWVRIDEEGRVLRAQIDASSGFDALDRAALDVAGRMRFTPALNMDERVRVWVSIPVRFEVR